MNALRDRTFNHNLDDTTEKNRCKQFSCVSDVPAAFGWFLELPAPREKRAIGHVPPRHYGIPKGEMDFHCHLTSPFTFRLGASSRVHVLLPDTFALRILLRDVVEGCVRVVDVVSPRELPKPKEVVPACEYTLLDAVVRPRIRNLVCHFF